MLAKQSWCTTERRDKYGNPGGYRRSSYEVATQKFAILILILRTLSSPDQLTPSDWWNDQGDWRMGFNKRTDDWCESGDRGDRRLSDWTRWQRMGWASEKSDACSGFTDESGLIRRGYAPDPSPYSLFFRVATQPFIRDLRDFQKEGKETSRKPVARENLITDNPLPPTPPIPLL